MVHRASFRPALWILSLAFALAVAGCGPKPPQGAATPGASATAAAQPVAGAAPGEAAPGEAATAGTVAAGQPGEAAPAPEPPPPPKSLTLAQGTPLEVVLGSSLSTKENSGGQSFSGSLARPIGDEEWTAAEKGAAVQGTIVESNPGGRVKGVAFLVLTLDRLTLADGRAVTLRTDSFTQKAKTTHGKDAAKIAGGAGVGALIGGIAGGGKGAAIGAVVGGGAGTGVVLATRGDPAKLAAGTRLTFRLQEPLTLTER